jgi:preprotein translocase subunit SecA
MKSIFKMIFGDPNEKALKSVYPLIAEINNIYEKYKKELKTQNDVLKKTSEFKERIKNGESLDKILPEAFALTKTACAHLIGKKWNVRNREITWDMVPYDVQLIGGIVLHKGNIAEMKTGEGKTLVCTLPVYLNALTEKGVYLVTVNDYLAHRDSEWMSGLYNYLGLSVGVIYNNQAYDEKKKAYACDITYGTNNEFGFDYLRDNMETDINRIVQKNLNYAIVDEVDSILIDEARTPLIISAPAEDSTNKYKKYATLIPLLKEGVHYELDEKAKSANLTEDGIKKMEELMGVENIYTDAGFEEVHHIEQALKATTCYKSDVDYMVKDGEIIIIDEFTGRLMQGRRYSHGLHQAIEAKENVEVRKESKTLATITFQNYFRLFNKLGGMTGTALTEAEEFYRIYGLDTIAIPTNKPVIRQDHADAIYKTQKGKMISAVKKIKELYAKKQPVLVGTISVEKSEMVSQLLKLEGIPHNVLNAKHHEREAEIIAEAGKSGAVTIATNMAGRGTDIKLGEGVKDLGGLFILGTERHEARRIDNQLRGRSGRQGDEGASQFFVSMEDDLMRLFGGDRMKKMMDMLKVPEDMAIENKMISNSIENSQKRVEGRNFDIRKHLVEYDDVINIHRDIVYKMRKKFLEKQDVNDDIKEMIKELCENIVRSHTEERLPREWNREEIVKIINSIDEKNNLKIEDIDDITNQNLLIQKIQDHLFDTYKKKEEILTDPKILRMLEKSILLRTTDNLWQEHIDEMSHLRENVAFSGYAQKDPLIEYKTEGYEKFIELLALIKTSCINNLFKIDFTKVVPSQLIKEEEKTLITNEDELNAQLEKENIASDNSNPVIIKVSGKSNVNAPAAEKVGRNDPCPCGSGKKYKKCCGKGI